MTNNVNYSTIPETLKCKPNWLFWKYETVGGEKRKPPTCANGKKINPHDPSNLHPFSIVEEKFDPQIHEGIGFSLTGSGFIGLDFDDCLTIPNDFSSLKDWAVPIVELIKGNYIEISPSGNGIKSFIKGKKPYWINETHIKKDDGKIEIHDHQYFTVTGNAIDDGKSEKENQEQINLTCKEILRTKQESLKPSPHPTPPPVSISNIDLEKRLSKARESKLGSAFKALYDSGDISICDNDHSKADWKLCSMLAFWLEKDEGLIDSAFRKSALMRDDKWNRHSGGGLTYGQRTIQKAIEITSKTYQSNHQIEIIDIHSKSEGVEPPEEPATDSFDPNTLKKFGLESNDPRYFREPYLDSSLGTDHYYSLELIDYVGQDLRWCEDKEKWLVWTGKYWADKDHLVFHKLQQLAFIFKTQMSNLDREIKELEAEIEPKPDSKEPDSDDDNKKCKPDKKKPPLSAEELHLESLRSRLGRLTARTNKFSNLARHRSVLEYSKPQLAISSKDLDMDKYLFNFQNCTVDLRTGEQREHRKDDYITKIIDHNYDPQAKADKWQKFINQVMGNDAEMVDYIQRIMGYSVNGSTDEQCLFIFYGAGSNGKSSLAETCMRVLGNYSRTVADDFFSLRPNREHPTEIAVLDGSRLVLGSESQGSKNSTLDEGKVKRLTGGDTLIGRFMNKDQFEFESTQTFILMVNNKPEVLGNDHGIWRRLKLVNFNQQFEGRNRVGNIKEQLYAEAEGILAWLVDGAVEYYKNGIQEPKSVTEASEEYRKEFDTISYFIEECCTTGSDLEIKSSVLYQAYKDWCVTNNEKCLNNRQFSETLQSKKFKKRKRSNILFCGISLSNLQLIANLPSQNDNSEGGKTEIREAREAREAKSISSEECFDPPLPPQPPQNDLDPPQNGQNWPNSVENFRKLDRAGRVGSLISTYQSMEGINVDESNLDDVRKEYDNHSDGEIENEFIENLKFLDTYGRKLE